MEPKVANMFGRGNENVFEEDKRRGPSRECEGEMGSFGSIHLDAPSPAPVLGTGDAVLK
jgi:hypothetical protein